MANNDVARLREESESDISPLTDNLTAVGPWTASGLPVVPVSLTSQADSTHVHGELGGSIAGGHNNVNVVHNRTSTYHFHNPSSSGQGQFVQGPGNVSATQYPHRPVRTESKPDAYARILLAKKIGYPLWRPYPSATPPEHRLKGVEIGDVGKISYYGTFVFLFNVFLNNDNDANLIRTLNMDPLERLNITTDDQAYTNRYVIRSEEVRIPRSGELISTDSNIERPPFHFICSPHEGAILVLPDRASRTDLVLRSRMEIYLKRNVLSWYKQMKEREDLVIVTGVDKCSSWGTACYTNTTETEEILWSPTSHNNNSTSIEYSWSPSNSISSCGGRNSNGDEKNQCIFIRAFKTKLRKKLPKTLLASSVSLSDVVTSEADKIPTAQSPGITHVSLLQSLLSKSPSMTSQHFPHEVLDDSIQVDDFPETNGPFHPSDLINSYLLEKSPGAQIAITHDDVWLSVIQDVDAAVTLSGQEILRRVLEKYDIVEEGGCVGVALRANKETSVFPTSVISSNTTRKPYSGSHRKLLIGIDVGTTFSGVSYSILDPGIVPVIQGVNRYPGQEKVGGDAKIPSVLYYDKAGVVRAVGAEAVREHVAESAVEEGWIKVEWFKLHLRPSYARKSTDEVPALPSNKTVVQVFGDFLAYLYQCTKSYIQETHASGIELWENLERQVEFVLTHPNGWEGPQQAQMRSAAIHGGLIPDTPEGHSRVQFATEGEASLHYCISNHYVSDVIQSGDGVIIVDAGGGTIDLSAYYMKEAPDVFEEIAPATCYFQGSVFVSRRAKDFLQRTLYNSRYGVPDDITHITDCFDKSTKLGFKDAGQPSFIKFGTSKDTDQSVDVKFGQLKLQGSDVEKFFEPTLATIRQAIQEQKTNALVPVKSVLLVGGFAASDWLFQKLKAYLQTSDMRIFRPDGHLSKAVADGAVAFYLDRLVNARVARTTFGVEYTVALDMSNPEHMRRIHTVINLPSGPRLSEAFDVILAKGRRVTEATVFRRAYFYERVSSSLASISIDIYAYRGRVPNPEWFDVDRNMFSVAGTVKAEALPARASIPRYGNDGITYYRTEYEIELLFGLTEHKAQICWKENGVEKRGPATIVYDQV